MNNDNKTELLLDGLDIQGLYLQDVFSIWQHFDRNGLPYLTIFMIDNSRITVPLTASNKEALFSGGHAVSEFIFNDGVMQEIDISTEISSASEYQA